MEPRYRSAMRFCGWIAMASAAACLLTGVAGRVFGWLDWELLRRNAQGASYLVIAIYLAASTGLMRRLAGAICAGERASWIAPPVTAALIACLFAWLLWMRAYPNPWVGFAKNLPYSAALVMVGFGTASALYRLCHDARAGR